MKKNVKIAIGIGVAALATVAIVQVRKKRKNQELGSGSVSISPVKVRFPLTIGSGIGDKSYQKEDVKKVQKALNILSYPPMAQLVVDGEFGDKTAGALDTLYKTKSVNEELFNKLTKNM